MTQGGGDGSPRSRQQEQPEETQMNWNRQNGGFGPWREAAMETGGQGDVSAGQAPPATGPEEASG